MSYRATLERQKAASTLQLLFRTARLLNEQAVARARRRTRHGELRAAHTSLLPHVDLQGTRLSELAKRLGVSKQAVGQLVDDLVELGTLERVPDPADGRAKLVRFSKRGQRDLLAGLELLVELQKELEAELGARRMAELHRTLELVLGSQLVTAEERSKS